MIAQLKDYRAKASELFLFDTNIWLFLFAPIGGYEVKKQEGYTKFLEHISSVNGRVVVTALVFSEIASVLYWKAFKDFEKALGQQGITADRKKNFLGSDKHNELLALTRSVYNSILKIADRYPDDFNSIDMPAIQVGMRQGSFEDAYYVRLAEKKKFSIVTDDRDFIKIIPGSVQIITYKL